MSLLPVHVGVSSLHFPELWQMAELEPSLHKCSSHEKEVKVLTGYAVSEVHGSCPSVLTSDLLYDTHPCAICPITGQITYV